MRAWAPDGVIPEFERTTIDFPSEDDGSLVATLVRKRVPTGSNRAVLYVHGFVDYFFHDHVANALVADGWDFYAVDLRRHGRSLRAGNRPNYCTDLAQYHDEITVAIDIIRQEENHSVVVLYGHSTGGLISSLYADHGARKNDISGVVLNSPFFGFKITPFERVKLGIAGLIGGFLPRLSDPKGFSPTYGESLHVTERGEWNYDLRWKPLKGFPIYFGWACATKRAHARLRRGLAIAVPVLVLHSNKSGPDRGWNDAVYREDIVLDVEHMRQISDRLGHLVMREEIVGAIHDVMLSREPVRTTAIRYMLQWLRQFSERSFQPSHPVVDVNARAQSGTSLSVAN